MLKQKLLLTGLTSLLVAISLVVLPQAMAQRSTTNFEGRGVAQGGVFTQGRNTNVNLILDGDNFSLEMQESGGRSGDRGRVQYRGVVVRRSDTSTTAGNFTLNTRVRSFDSSDSLRVINNTAGTCRMEVFGARVTSVACDAIADNSSTRFLGLEQF